MSKDQLQREVERLREESIQIQKVYQRNVKNEEICIAQGYEIHQELTAEVDGQMQTWTERRFLLQSTNLAQSMEQTLQKNVKKAEQAIQTLLVRKQGKPLLKTRVEIDEAIQAVLKKFHAEGLLDVFVHEEIQERTVRS